MHKIQHLREALIAAVIGVRYFRDGRIRSEGQKQIQGAVIIYRAHSLQIRQILFIHCQDVIKVFKIPGTDLSRPQVAQVIAALARFLAGSAIRRVPDMPVAGAARIHRYRML